MVNKIMLLFLVIAYTSLMLHQSVFGHTNDTSHQVLQVLSTGDLWSGTQMETPAFVKLEFEELELMHQISLPAMIPTSAIQACVPEGKIFVMFPIEYMTRLKTVLTVESLWPTLKFTIEPFAAPTNHMKSAELRVFLETGNNNLATHPDLFMIRVYQIVSNRALSAPDSHRLLSVSYPSISTNYPGQWLTFNVLAAVQDWANNVRENLGFLLTGMQPSNTQQSLLVITFMAQQGTQNSVPFEVQSGHTESSFDEAVTSRPSCTLTSLRLNLTHWGLLGPHRLNIGQCTGACGTSELLAFHHVPVHTALTSILATQNSSLKQPCCVPAEYRPAPVLYRAGNGNFIIRILSDFVVATCVCK